MFKSYKEYLVYKITKIELLLMECIVCGMVSPIIVGNQNGIYPFALRIKYQKIFKQAVLWRDSLVVTLTKTRIILSRL